MSRACPECGEPDADRKDNRFRPFCGRRCQQLDLMRWLDEDYALSDPLIPGMSRRLDDEPESSDGR